MIETTQIKMCDVCRLLDYDTTQKQCFYCGMCDAWICEADQNRWDRRIKSAVKRKLEPGYKGVSNYEELATQSIQGGNK